MVYVCTRPEHGFRDLLLIVLEGLRCPVSWCPGISFPLGPASASGVLVRVLVKPHI